MSQLGGFIRRVQAELYDLAPVIAEVKPPFQWLIAQYAVTGDRLCQARLVNSKDPQPVVGTVLLLEELMVSY